MLHGVEWYLVTDVVGHLSLSFSRGVISQKSRDFDSNLTHLMKDGA
jgi:hypothetical protein